MVLNHLTELFFISNGMSIPILYTLDTVRVDENIQIYVSSFLMLIH